MSARNGGYGTLPDNDSPAPNGTDAERAALLSKPSGGHALASKIQKHFSVNVNKKWGDLALLGCYIITGLLDSASVFIWGSFVSMQTGPSLSLATASIDMAIEDQH